jgi:hypothetical protein
MNMKLYSPRNVSGGTIDGAVIGGTTPAAGTFTTGEFASVKITNGQIAFPATAVPSADPNTLDDYEEGNWTPTKSGFTEAGGGSYALSGHYVKIGGTVFITGSINCLTTATIASPGGTTNAIQGMPFSAVADAAAVISFSNSYTMASYGFGLITGAVLYPDAWGPTGAGQGVRFSGQYIT